jgi:sec-independent protein translocase protein TatB
MHFGDYTFIFLLALVLFGPKKLPEIGRQLGKLLAEFRRASNEFKFQIQEELRNMEDEERRKKAAEQEAVRTASPAVGAPPPEPVLPASTGPTILPPSIGDAVSTSKPFATPGPLEETAGFAAPPENEVPLDAPPPTEPSDSSRTSAESQEAIDPSVPADLKEPLPNESQNGVHPAAEEAAVHHD